MFDRDDPKVIANTEIRRKWFKEHPEDDLKVNLSEEEIAEIEEERKKSKRSQVVKKPKNRKKNSTESLHQRDPFQEREK